jgi:hypothetical protein
VVIYSHKARQNQTGFPAAVQVQIAAAHAERNLQPARCNRT